MRICVFLLSVFLFILPSKVGAHTADDLIASLNQASFPKEYLEQLFSDPRIKNINAPATQSCKDVRGDITKNGAGSRFSLLGQASITHGVEYYNEHKSVFEYIERRYGVAPEYLLALLWIETYFGVCLGDYYLLARLYNKYTSTKNKRTRERTVNEIAAFISSARKYSWEPYTLVGSHASAFGLTQFLPSSFRFAVDGNNDGTIDLFNPADALPSSANFLVINHWRISKRAALWNYNHSQDFVAKVLKYAQAIGPYITPSN